MVFNVKKKLRFASWMVESLSWHSHVTLTLTLLHYHSHSPPFSFSLSFIIILTLLAFSCYEIFTESLTRGRKGCLTNLEISIQPTLTRKENNILKEGLLGVTLLKKSRNVLLEHKDV